MCFPTLTILIFLSDNLRLQWQHVNKQTNKKGNARKHECTSLHILTPTPFVHQRAERKKKNRKKKTQKAAEVEKKKKKKKKKK